MKVNEKKLWKLEIISERIHNLALVVAVEASRIKPFSKTLAVFLDEMRKLSQCLHEHIEKYKFQDTPVSEMELDKTITDFSSMAGLLSINGSIIGINYVKEKFVIVCSDELYRYSMDLLQIVSPELAHEAFDFEIAEVSKLSKTSDESIDIISFSIGGISFAENVRFVQEVLYYHGAKSFIQNGKLQFRGKEIDVIDCYTKLNLSAPSDEGLMRVLIINTNSSQLPKYIAVPVDKVNTIFQSRLGEHTRPDTSGVNPEIVRECWNTNIGRQILFPDWEKLMGI